MSSLVEKNETAVLLEREKIPLKQGKQDFKMVTFSLGGKDYGIDIMKVKEIAKFSQFTYVPNTPPFVRGVYNLRGEIISIIDLRIFFHLPIQKRKDEVENGLILRLDDYLIGVIVDSIDKVVGIDSDEIQPPHPIFGDVNVKYISGVVEHNGTLYLILDAEKLFGKEQSAQKVSVPISAEEPPAPKPVLSTVEAPPDQTEKSFIQETLRTFKSFHVTPLNARWIDLRFEEWKKERAKQGRDLQIKSAEEADEFLSPFFSPNTNAFWSDEVGEAFLELVEHFSGNLLSVWDVGCGNGYETYSIAALLLKKFPNLVLKVWAMDKDLLSVSTAPNLVFTLEKTPSYLVPFTVKGKQGISISSFLKERILFEYHDILHVNVVPESDLIVARDILSFLSPPDQAKVLEEFHGKLKPHGVLILGLHEEPLDPSLWVRVPNKYFAAFKKNME